MGSTSFTIRLCAVVLLSDLSFALQAPPCAPTACPITELIAAHTSGAPRCVAWSADGRIAFIATGAAVTILDVSAPAVYRELGVVETPDAAASALLLDELSEPGTPRLFMACDNLGLWVIDLCPALFAPTPAPCTNLAARRIDVAGVLPVAKRCVDLAIVQNNATAGRPVLCALFASLNNVHLPGIGPTELRTYKIEPVATPPLTTAQQFPAYLSHTFVSAPTDNAKAVGSALASDPDDPSSLYVAVGAAGVYRIGLGTTLTESSLPLPNCVTCAPGGDFIADVVLYDAPGSSTNVLYACSDELGLLEWVLPATAAPVVVSALKLNDPGYPYRLAVSPAGPNQVIVFVSTSERSSYPAGAPAPYLTTGGWQALCTVPGFPVPYAMPSTPANFLNLLVRNFATRRTQLYCNAETLIGATQSELGLWDIDIRRSSTDDWVALAASPFGGIHIGAVHRSQNLVASLVSENYPVCFPAFDGNVAATDSRVVFFGVDETPGGRLETGILRIATTASGERHFETMSGTQTLCGTASVPPPIAVPGCVHEPNPHRPESILGVAHWADAHGREWMLPGMSTVLRHDVNCVALPGAAQTGDPCASASLKWKREFLSPATSSRSAWAPTRMDLAGGSLDLAWWQIPTPLDVDPAYAAAVVDVEADFAGYQHSDISKFNGDVIIALRGASIFGLQVFRRDDLQAYVEGPAGVQTGNGDPKHDLVGNVRFHDVRTHVEFEYPTLVPDPLHPSAMMPGGSPCESITFCPNGVELRNARGLLNSRSHTFRADGKIVTAVAAGWVATSPAPPPSGQPSDCVWQAEYGRPLISLFDVTETMSAAFAEPELLRVGIPQLPAGETGSMWACSSKNFPSSQRRPAGTTYLYAADLSGKLWVFDVSPAVNGIGPLRPRASTPYLPANGPGLPVLPSTPILRPVAVVDFGVLFPDAVDAHGPNCVDVEIIDQFAYCALGRAGVAVVQIQDTVTSAYMTPLVVCVLETPGIAVGLAQRVDENGNDQLLVGDERCGIRLYARPGE